MNVSITKPAAGGTVRAVASKSQAHRLLIAAALSSSATRVACSETSDDIDATVRCLTALGAAIDYADGVFNVTPIARPVTGARQLDCGESGSTLRFMLPVGCALGADATYHMSGRLPSRPLSPLYDELISHGCALSAQGINPIHAGGQLEAGRFTIPGNISSQYISGLLLALPLLKDDSVIQITGPVESKPYIDMTLAVTKAFGVEVLGGDSSYRVRGRQKYHAPGDVNVEGDWSNAAFWLCMGALTPQGVTVTNLDDRSLQGDRGVLDILRRLGARVEVSQQNVTISRGKLSGITIDVSDTPDLVPVVAAVAAAAEGRTVIRNAQRLRIKESDRLQSITAALTALGADVTETRDGLIINGKDRLQGGTVDAAGDHRIAMACAVAAAVCDGPVFIQGAEAVNKSYPAFFQDYAALGGMTEEVG
jgi:3-phosphoshikimate 1-carboxyvinyltransferase